MGKGPEQTFFQRRHSDGQQLYEEVLNITNHQRNANQNTNEISPHTCQNILLFPKIREITNVGKDVEKRELSCTVGMYIGRATMENSMAVPQKLKIELPYDPAIPLLGIYPKEIKTVT